MNIVKQKWIFLNSTYEFVPKQLRKLYQFGISVLVLKRIDSLRSNARSSDLNWFTSKSKAYRLLTKAKLLKTFTKLLVSLDIVNSDEIIVVDFSDFGNGFQVLMFAKQTRKGRTIPLYFEIIQYPITKGSQNLFIVRTIINFTKIIGFKPKLVFDRGFACPYIIRFLGFNGYVFYLRIKKDKLVFYQGNILKTRELTSQDNLLEVYDLNLRLVISDQRIDQKEPWYILTNDFYSSVENVIEIYYFRFEIEEFFRDAKRLLGLEHVNFHKQLSLAITLWFVILGLWFIWSLEDTMTELEKAARAKMKLSLIRYYFEQLQKDIILAGEAVLMAQMYG